MTGRVIPPIVPIPPPGDGAIRPALDPAAIEATYAVFTDRAAAAEATAAADLVDEDGAGECAVSPTWAHDWKARLAGGAVCAYCGLVHGLG